MNLFFKKKSGFMLIEILVGLSVIMVASLAFWDVSSKIVSLSSRGTRLTQTSFLLEEGAEIVKILRDNNWSNISNLNLNTDYYPNFSAGNWSLSSSPNVIDIFTRTIRFSAVNRDSLTGDIASVGINDPQTRLVTITVNFQEGNGEIISRTLSFYIIDIFS